MKVITVRLPDDLAEALKARKRATGVTTNHLISRLIRMELESVRESKYEIKMETRSKPTLESYYRPSVLVAEKVEKE